MFTKSKLNHVNTKRLSLDATRIDHRCDGVTKKLALTTIPCPSAMLIQQHLDLVIRRNHLFEYFFYKYL